MQITLLAAIILAMSGCGPMDEEAPAPAPDADPMVATGGSGGSGGTGTGGTTATTGGSGGQATGGVSGAGGVAGSGGAPAPDAQPMNSDAQPGGPPQACMVDRLHSYVCMDPPNTKGAKVLYKDGRACNLCTTAKPDGNVDKYYVGCIPAPGAICVMSCGECKPL